jgi:hypothetical protein
LSAVDGIRQSDRGIVAAAIGRASSVLGEWLALGHSDPEETNPGFPD